MSRDLRIAIADADGRSLGEVSALLSRPRGARAVYVAAHGAGAGMHHPFMQAVTDGLAARRVAVLRFQFRYMEAGRKAPDRAPVLAAAIRAALDTARRKTRGLPIIAGGKSMGGRISSHVMAADPPPYARGLAFLGFPLHAAGKPGRARAAHLADVAAPMLFLQGTRDNLADIDEIRAVCRELGKNATLHIAEHADHSFHVPRRSGRTDAEVMDEILDAFAGWLDAIGL